MHKQLASKLYQLSQAQIKEHQHKMSIWQPFQAGYLSQELYQLACATKGVESMPDSDILTAFCEPEAVALLLKMPNVYFFWQVFHRSTVLATDGGTEGLITLNSLRKAVGDMRRDLGHKYDLRVKLAGLKNFAQVASRTTSGLVLVNFNLFEHDSAYDNPLFFEEEFFQ
jgi:hypothetical protein